MTIHRVRTVFTGPPGSPWLNTMYFNAAAGLTQDAANAVGLFWSTVDSQLSDDVAWATEPDVVSINEATGNPTGVESTTPTAGAGALAGEISPTVLQALVRWRTGVFVDGREIRGRTFIPGLGEAVLNDGFPQSTSRTVFADAADALMAALSTEFVVWQRPRPEEDPPNPEKPARVGSFAVATVASVPNRFSVLRSRRD